ncbi:MAG TPA: heterodisulfide reductase-related iron-sulfur binding cluster, partial [Gammaproteobacteria bacterium]|nr:heterodisulfide reductase-related iron-sulfur binding cluster [Gammaproteobacteria bacterium]
MQGLATGVLEATPRLAAHLDHCLACRACEAVCPAEVPYGRLIDAARLELRRRGHGEPGSARLFALFMRGRFLRRLFHRLLWLSGRLKLTALMGRIGPASLRRRIELLPLVMKPKAWREVYSSRAATGEKVSLFLGCVADISQPQVTAAAIGVLNALGVEVALPRAQGCCGALDQHAGRRGEALHLARSNLAAFSGSAVVLGTASGCLATLKDYPDILGAAATDFSARVMDVSQFIGGHKRFPKILFEPWKAKVLVQTPCTLRNVLKTGATVPELLHRIPKLEVLSLPASLGCCGAAGSYMLTQPEQADAFAAEFVAAIAKQKPDVLVSSNVGCAMHLQAALRRKGLDIPVMHPVEVLSRQLPEALYRPV